MGHDPLVWYWEDFPRYHQAAIHLGPGLTPAADLGLGRDGPFDVVWMRRQGEPMPVDGCHPDDAEVVLAESRIFLENLLAYIGHTKTRWINDDFGTRGPLRSKAAQLQLAARLGFRIPSTLIGNDVGKVREFFKHHQGRIVHKSFTQARWDNADGSRTISRTSEIKSQHIENDYAVKACPGIYQERIDKRHELRITVMGNTAIAAAIYSQQDGPTIDWRCEGGRGETNLRAIALDTEVEARCLALCRELGLEYGCIDLIVAPDGGIVFLEVNAGGQFLFKEQADPSLLMLQAFCNFLLTGDAKSTGEAPLRMADYSASETGRANALAAHKLRLAALQARKAS